MDEKGLKDVLICAIMELGQKERILLHKLLMDGGMLNGNNEFGGNICRNK